jgi:hypothetical protein
LLLTLQALVVSDVTVTLNSDEAVGVITNGELLMSRSSIDAGLSDRTSST